MASSGKCTGRLAPVAQLQLVVVMVLVGALCAHARVNVDPNGPTLEVKATFITFKNNLSRDAVKFTQPAPLAGKETSVVVPPGQSRTIRKNSLGPAAGSAQLRFIVGGVEYVGSPPPPQTRVVALALTPVVIIQEVGYCQGKPGLKYEVFVKNSRTNTDCARPAMKSRP